MADHSTGTEQPTASSPWPVLVAVGLVLSEVGVFVDLFPIAVGGIVLFAASVTGFVAESGHVSSPRPLAIGLGLVFVALGTLLYALGTELVIVAGSERLFGLASRGLAIAVAGVVTVVGAVALRYRNA
ncbi:DUF7541 family protein [Natronococcus wangiae]|uniref:DUF7541 family protein n=1 Tax=Natronococcus wangiae TaxID=3068275 RepID=UPI00273F0C5B|nr:hypothetical protein [Natronococcus sp. AD5]